MKKLLVTLFGIVIATTMFAQKLYNQHKSTTQYGVFHIKYPAEWSQLDHPSTVFSFTENGDSGFNSNINLTVSSSSGNLENDMQATLQILKQHLQGFELLEEKMIEIQDRLFGKITYQHYMSNQVLKVVLYQTINKGRLINITGTSSVSDFTSSKEIFNKMIESFDIK